jgi:hypothetical protein
MAKKKSEPQAKRMWAIVTPQSSIILATMRDRRKWAIDSYAVGIDNWTECRRMGYRCVRVEVRRYEAQKA